jgi:hypothetical protein
MLLESDVSLVTPSTRDLRIVVLTKASRWKDVMDKRMQRMEEMMAARENPIQNVSQISPTEPSIEMFNTQDRGLDSFSQPPQHLREVVPDPRHGPGAIPASCVFELSNTLATARQRPSAHRRTDIISQGIIALAAAEKYFDHYQNCLDPATYNVLAEHTSLASIRGESPLLVAVVCTVSALQTASPDYQKCYQALRDEYTAQLLSREHSFEDVRALCIGAFFLSDLSWSLVGAG